MKQKALYEAKDKRRNWVFLYAIVRFCVLVPVCSQWFPEEGCRGGCCIS